MRSRAIRRHHKQRMKRKVLYMWHKIWRMDDEIEPGTWADHLKECSCYMCGNPRKHFNEKTQQEKKADLTLEENIRC